LKGKLILILLLIAAIIPPTAAYLLVPSSGPPTVSVTKIYNTRLQTGQTIIVNVSVSDVPALVACDVDLAFDPSVLKVTTGDPHGFLLGRTRYGIYEGPFFKSSTNQTMFLVNDVNNKKGNISAIYGGIIPSGISSSGSGVIASINFTCVNATTNTAIRITGPSQGHSTLQPSTKGVYDITHQDIDGFVTADGSPGIWTELWFQATASVVIVETIVVALGILVTTRWWRSRAEAESKESAEVDELFK
jgi:hypothetical protein